MTPTDDVISKIRKLMALQQSPNEHEAALAASKMQDLMAIYNLEIHQIQAADKKAADAADTTKRVRHTDARSGLFEFQRKLWKAVANVNFCWYENIEERKKNTLGVWLVANHRHFLIGSEVNVLAATIMADYLEDVIKRLCPYKVGKPMFSWKEGCADRLVERLNDKRYELERQSREAAERAQAAGGTSTALVRLQDVFQTEEDLNFREKYGVDAYERRLAYRHNRQECPCKYCTADRDYWARIKEQQNQAVLVRDDDEPPAKPETEAQRRKREEREARRSERFWESERRKEERKWAKKDMSAYHEGQRRGDDIGLDPQIRGGGGGRLK